MAVDFGRTAADYARHRHGFPDAFFDRIARDWRVGLAGQRVLDVGTGTGTLARGFARRGCRAVGLDPSEPLLVEARRLAADAGLAVDWVVGRAEATGLEAARFDVVTAGQCWHWLRSGEAAAEARRVLVPGGALVIAHMDWIPLPGNVVAATEELIAKVNPSWPWGGGHGLWPAWLGDLAAAGFSDLETFSFDTDLLYDHAAWRGRIRASNGVGASLPPDAVARFDEEHAAMLAARFPDEPLAVPHRIFALRGVSSRRSTATTEA